jgi:hypothetical protein
MRMDLPKVNSSKDGERWKNSGFLELMLKRLSRGLNCRVREWEILYSLFEHLCHKVRKIRTQIKAIKSCASDMTTYIPFNHPCEVWEVVSNTGLDFMAGEVQQQVIILRSSTYKQYLYFKSEVIHSFTYSTNFFEHLMRTRYCSQF